MLSSIQHRGPDSFDLLSLLGSSVGGCRLGIVGSPTCPMPRLQDGTLVLLNGELYNYLTLAREMNLGALDSLDPESHLIHHLVQREGWQGLGLLRGIFSIVVLNQNRTLMARDRLGIKPLFYSIVGDEVVFGSEMKAILADSRVSTALDEQAMDETCVFGYISSPGRTPFASIKQVPPGCVVEVSGGRVLVHKYWEPEPARHGGAESCADSAAAVLKCLRSGLGQMLHHDPLDKGFYLSGGVDSSLLVMLAAQLQDGPPLTFTLADGGDTPDLLAAREVAAAVGADHHEFRVTVDDYLRELPVFVHHYENVVAGGVFDIHGGMAFQMLSRRISEHVRVAFSGEGADELFGGYYWAHTHPLGFSDRIRGRLDAIGSPDAVAEQVSRLFPRPEDESVYRRNLFDFLIRGGLSNYHLWSVDRSCSAFGFEVRPAYLHDDLVELALSLPIEAKVLGGETKRVLKEAARPLFDHYGVSDLLNRKKSGMPAAVARIAPQIETLARGFVSEADLASHPFRRWVKSPLDAVMFDLFHYVFVENRGALPTGFDVGEFYGSGDRARMYR
ncbi:MAG: asparagine synthase-related protein [Actinomycetota bacterium]|nr:asparagine synthase-related protein [Actinomycetota bacterium]